MKSTTQIHYQTFKCLFQVGHTEGGEQIRCESQWEEEASETNVVLRTSSSCVLLMVVNCLLQISVCLASGDGWPRPRQSPDTPLMSHSSHSKPALSLCTATRWRVMDGLSYMQEKFPPWLIIKEDSYKTEHILWLKYIYCSNASLDYFQTASSVSCLFVCLFILLIPFTFSSLFAWSLSERCFFASAQIIQEFGKGTRDRRGGQDGQRVRNFFLTRPTSVQFKSYYLPLALQHCGIEWNKEEARLQQRAHCRLIRAFWAGRPPLPAPWEAPHTTARRVNGGPSWEPWQTC